MAVADVNGDGQLDFVTTSYLDADLGDISVFLGGPRLLACP